MDALKKKRKKEENKKKGLGKRGPERKRRERERETNSMGRASVEKKTKAISFVSFIHFYSPLPIPFAPTFSLFRIRVLSAFYSSLLAPYHESCSPISRQIWPTCIS